MPVAVEEIGSDRARAALVLIGPVASAAVAVPVAARLLGGVRMGRRGGRRVGLVLRGGLGRASLGRTGLGRAGLVLGRRASLLRSGMIVVARPNAALLALAVARARLAPREVPSLPIRVAAAQNHRRRQSPEITQMAAVMYPSQSA